MGRFCCLFPYFLMSRMAFGSIWKKRHQVEFDFFFPSGNGNTDVMNGQVGTLLICSSPTSLCQT